MTPRWGSTQTASRNGELCRTGAAVGSLCMSAIRQNSLHCTEAKFKTKLIYRTLSRSNGCHGRLVITKVEHRLANMEVEV